MLVADQWLRDISWEKAEELFPCCSPQWDIQAIDEEIKTITPDLEYYLDIRTIDDHLYVDIKFSSFKERGLIAHWIRWDSDTQRWSHDVDYQVLRNRLEYSFALQSHVTNP